LRSGAFARHRDSAPFAESFGAEDLIPLSMLDELGATPAHLVGFSDGGKYELLMAALNLARYVLS
jgi:hypothetical protein